MMDEELLEARFAVYCEYRNRTGCSAEEAEAALSGIEEDDDADLECID